MVALAPPPRLTEHQLEVSDAIIASTAFRQTLAGLAGTGKTTLLRHIYETWTRQGLKTFVMGPTGKSTVVLRQKGVPARTIHQTIYRFGGTKEDEKGEIELIFHDNKKRHFCDRLIVDEGSMLTAKMVRDIEERGIPVLYVGDPGQLPPVKAKDPHLFVRPTHTLTEIHRQAADNPVIQYAYAVRNGAPLTHRHSGVNHVEVRGRGAKFVASQLEDEGIDRLIVANNAQRVAVNRAYRDIVGLKGVVAVGDEIICVLNNQNLDVVNGEIFDVLGVKHGIMSSEVELRSKDTGRWTRCHVWNPQFGQEKTITDEIDDCYMLADYAKALTCHKAQGSSWPRVGIAARGCVEDGRRWNYTAVTRTEAETFIFC